MKKITLLASLFMTVGLATAQLSQSDEPSVGDSQTFYVIDSSATEYENITGTGVEWDYSMYGGYGSITKELQVLDPANTQNASSFPTSTAAISLEDGVTRFSNSTATEAVSQGFVLYEVTLGEVRLELDTDEATVAQYPMQLQTPITDSYEGTLYYSYSGVLTNSPTLGTVTTEYDGEGTLKLANGTTHTGVHRIKTIDTSLADIALLNATIELVRRQYDYYDYTVSNLPVFSIVYLKVGFQGSSPLTESNLVLSTELPVDFVSVDEELCINCETKVYPNPASDKLNVLVSENVEVSIYSMTGQLVTSKRVNKGGVAHFNISDFKQGVYLVKIEGDTTRKIERVVIR